MTDSDLAAIRHCIDNGLGLTHERARTLLLALEEAREVARDYFSELPHMGEYLFHKHHCGEQEEYPWLPQVYPFGGECQYCQKQSSQAVKE